MPDFSALADRLDAEADNRLGDSILYATGAGRPFVEIRGRIRANEPPAFSDRQDQARQGWRLRVSKSVVPNPSMQDRLQCPAILGDDTYRPVGPKPIGDGRYWLVDIQKV